MCVCVCVCVCVTGREGNSQGATAVVRAEGVTAKLRKPKLLVRIYK